MLRASVFSSFVAFSLFACADSSPVDELAGESPADGEDGKGDSAAAFGFFAVTPDVRACSFDARCGGFFVSRPNRSSTICGRGVQGERCYVDTLDFSGTALPESIALDYEARIRAGETILLRGDIAPAPDDRGASLHVTEVWTAGSATGVIDGVFVLAKDNGIRCITAPCPSISEYRVNSNHSAQLDEIDLEASGADQDAIDRAHQGLFEDGVIIVGDRYYPSNGGKGRAANQFFTKAPVPLHF
jgi:hypothetical protein